MQISLGTVFGRVVMRDSYHAVHKSDWSASNRWTGFFLFVGTSKEETSNVRILLVKTRVLVLMCVYPSLVFLQWRAKVKVALSSGSLRKTGRTAPSHKA